jgi:hypothetical protein
MSHHQPGPDHSHHSHGGPESLSLDQKLAKLLDHWAQHNEAHARTYREWAARARDAGLAPVADHLESAADRNLGINGEFAAALKLLAG